MASNDKSALFCERCAVEMKPKNAHFSYLGKEFNHEVMRCPICGQVYVPEELAKGRMKTVEMALEDK